MFKNIWKITLRNLLKKPGFTITNIAGLGLGMASCLIMSLYVWYDLSYDDFQDETVYRLALNRVYPEREVDYAFVPHSITPQMVEDFPEVMEQARIFKVFGPLNIRIGEDQFNEENVIFADSTLFKILNISFLEGDPSSALSEPDAMVITETIAKKLFGRTDVIGEIVETANGPVNISAVAKDYPKNSHFGFDYLLALHSLPFFQQTNWTGFSCLAYIKTNEKADPNLIEEKFPDLIRTYADGEIQARNGISYDEYIAAGNGYNYKLQPIQDIHLYSNLEGELKPNGNITYIYIFSIVAVFILIIASINFMNLATARSTERGKEVGIRKVMGSSRNQLISQFLLESVIITFISCLISLLLVQLSLPFFNDIAGRSLNLGMMINLEKISLIFGVVLLIGLISGIYPAFFISAFSPLRVMKGELKTSNSGINLRNTLVVVQFAISIALISSTIIISSQMNFLMNKSLGFDQEQVLVIDNAFALNNLDQEINWSRYETFRNEITQLPEVTNASYTSAMPGDNLPGYLLRIQGSGKESMVARNITFDHEMQSSMRMDLTQGRFFDQAFNDSLSMILNETAVDKLGIQEPVLGSKVININNDNELVEYTVIGVVKDFHFQSLHIDVEPIAITSREDANAFFTKLIVRFNEENPQTGIALVEEKWNDFVSDNPFSYYILDDQLARFYDAERATMKIFSFFTVLAIIIACIGLLGLSAFIINQRIKEIGVRKVLGASTGQIIWRLGNDFGKLIIISAFIAVPSSYLWIRSWLENFAYSISVPWLSFLLAVVIALIIGWVTVGMQTYKAATVDPVKSLRDE